MTEPQMAERRTQLCGNLSHQFVGPLNTILNGAEYIQTSLQKGSPAQQQEAIKLSAQAIQDSARWLDRLAQNLLDLLALFSDTLCPNSSPIELCSQLHNMLELCQPYAQRQGITLHWNREEMPVQAYVFADEALMDRILLNLISNAVKFGKSEGNVWVTLEAQDESCCIRIRDDGLGIPQEEQKLLFDPYREMSPSAIQNGTGIGLYLANEFCRVMEWKMQLQSDSQGTEVTVTVPVKKNALTGAVSMASGALAQEIRRQEQASRVMREMSALFGE